MLGPSLEQMSEILQWLPYTLPDNGKSNDRFKKSGLNQNLSTKKSIIFQLSPRNLVKRTPIELVILTEFHDDSSKFVDFLLLVKFLDSPVFYESVSMIAIIG